MRRRPVPYREINYKKLAVIAALILVLGIAFAFLLVRFLIPSSRYKAAVDLYQAEQYDEAIAAFSALEGYKDSQDYLERCYIGKAGQERYNLVKSINIGDSYVFGAYEQDNDSSNGKEGIEWIVLDKQGLSVLLLSKYALDGREYHTPRVSCTWETCHVRQWLNDSFLNEAFSPEEQSKILYTTVNADKNPLRSTSPGNGTTDKVFLLSIPEATRYFDSDRARQCRGTPYCYAQGAYEANNGCCLWWLRTPGDIPSTSVFVLYDGTVYDFGYFTYAGYDGAIRPALWLDLSA